MRLCSNSAIIMPIWFQWIARIDHAESLFPLVLNSFFHFLPRTESHRFAYNRLSSTVWSAWAYDWVLTATRHQFKFLRRLIFFPLLVLDNPGIYIFLFFYSAAFLTWLQGNEGHRLTGSELFCFFFFNALIYSRHCGRVRVGTFECDIQRNTSAIDICI